MGKPIVIISGNDPAAGSGGHSRYVRTQAGIIKRLGFAPHIFCAAPRSEIVETDYAVIHRVASPHRPFRHLMVIAHAGRVIAAVENFLADGEGPHLLHTFGVWGYVGAKITMRLHARGVKVIHVVPLLIFS